MVGSLVDTVVVVAGHNFDGRDCRIEEVVVGVGGVVVGCRPLGFDGMECLGVVADVQCKTFVLSVGKVSWICFVVGLVVADCFWVLVFRLC